MHNARALRDEMMLWVYPYDDLRWGSMLVVNEYEKAIFMRDGKVYDVFPAGRYLITTQNLPLLTSAFNLLAGYGETPFKAKVVFVSLKQFKSKLAQRRWSSSGPKINFPSGYADIRRILVQNGRPDTPAYAGRRIYRRIIQR